MYAIRSYYASFGIMVVALLIGARIILASMFKARRLENGA